MTRKLALKTLCAAIGLTLGHSALAQDQNLPSSFSAPLGIGSVPFDLLPPGARSLGLAGAFTAVADDATASEANPAGLTSLTRPEVSIHLRNTSFDLTRYNGDARYANRYDGNSVPAGQFPLYTEASGDTSAIAFASYVYPFDNGAVSIYYQNTGKIRNDSEHTAESTTFYDFFEFTNDIDLNAQTVGLSGAYRINDMFAIGASLRSSSLSLSYLNRAVGRYLFDLEGTPPNPASATDVLSFERSMDDSDRDITFNLGLLINPGGKLSAGIVYKDGGTYTLNARSAFSARVGLTGQPLVVDLAGALDDDIDVSLPDVLNVGIAYRPTDTWLVSFDVHQTRYSQLPPLPAASLIFGSPAPDAVNVGTAQNPIYTVGRLDNSTTFHLGAEHSWLFAGDKMMGLRTLTLRGGVFNEDDLGPYNNEGNLEGTDTKDTHFTIGLGGTFNDNKFQVDLAAEFSEDTDNIVLSAIYRF